MAWMDRVVDDGLLSSQNRSLIHSDPDPVALLASMAADDRSAAPKWDS